MTSDLQWVFAFNILINSFLSFITTAVLFKLVIAVFRIKGYRLRAFLLSLAVIKLPLDLFLYDFSIWALLKQINPLQAAVGTRMIGASLASPLPHYFPETRLGFSVMHEASGYSFTLADLIALKHPLLIKCAVVACGLITLFLLMRLSYRITFSVKKITEICRKASPCQRPICNQLLLNKVLHNHVKVLVSADVDVPCAFGVLQKTICFPLGLVDTLSQGEFEAVIAHEFAHLKWHDGSFRLIQEAISTLFWWVPKQWWLRQMEFEQEKAADSAIKQYDIPKLDLASAMIKAAKGRNHYENPFYVCFLKPGNLKSRLNALLTSKETAQCRIIHYPLQTLSLVIAFSIVTGRLWIF